MYFPYLYARGSELLALRAMLEDHRPLEKLVPVLEPVLRDPNRLIKTIEAFGRKKRTAIILLNPHQHELEGSAERKTWHKDVAAALSTARSVLPGWRCSPGDTKANVDAFIGQFAGREVALAYDSPALTERELTALAGHPDVRYHLVLNGALSASRQRLLPAGKRVDIRDKFKKLKRNADYSGQEFFSDRHSTYEKDKWLGFGDYLCIGRDFAPGGGPPAAIALHAVYERDESEIWVEHFLSTDTSMDVGDTGTKFLQAAAKLAKAAKARPNQFGSNFALDAFAQYVAANHFPGLPKSKELQISHHLCHSLDVLNGML